MTELLELDERGLKERKKIKPLLEVCEFHCEGIVFFSVTSFIFLVSLALMVMMMMMLTVL